MYGLKKPTRGAQLTRNPPLYINICHNLTKSPQKNKRTIKNRTSAISSFPWTLIVMNINDIINIHSKNIFIIIINDKIYK